MKNKTNPIINTLPNSGNAGLDCLCIGGRYFIMQEIWKDVVGYEGYYQVSNLGRVKGVDRYIRNGRHYKERILKQSKNIHGYLFTSMSINSKQETKIIHHLVAQSFLGHKCGRKLVVDHINNIRTDNRLENLQIITQRENSSKDRKGGTSKYVGVSWCKIINQWKSQIVISDRNYNLGRFKNELDAHNAYQNKLREIKEQMGLAN